MSSISSIPLGAATGGSSSTSYTAGTGLTLNGTEFSITPFTNKNFVIISDVNGKLVASSVTTSKLGFLDVSSSIQGSINSLSSSITTINGSLTFLDATSSIQTQINTINTTLGTKLNLTGGALTGSITIPSGSFLYSNAISVATGSIAITAASPGNIAMYAPAGALYFNTASTSRLQITGTGAFIRDYESFTPTTGATITVVKSITVINPAAAIAALTITLPTALNGQQVTITTTQSITATSFTGVFVNGSAPAANVLVNPGVPVSFMYITKGVTGWIRIG